ncbi:hypothetical protein JW721_05405 [Candidatus Micrarchaeota archaeon]|nr:hypothetical protein [Candidatus Micrarchaeota archaeon]
MSPQKTKKNAPKTDITPSWMTPQMEQWLSGQLGVDVGKSLGEIGELSSRAAAAEKGKLIEKGDSSNEVWKAANLLAYKSTLDGMVKRLDAMGKMGNESVAKEFSEKFPMAPASKLTQFAKSLAIMEKKYTGDAKWVNKPLKKYSESVLSEAESLSKISAPKAERKEAARAPSEFLQPAISAEEETAKASSKKPAKEGGASMVFTSEQLYEPEKYLRSWLKKNMPGYEAFRKKAHEYTQIYNTAGETLEYYYNKATITFEDQKLIKAALDVRKSYLENLKALYSKTIEGLPKIKAAFMKSVEGQSEEKEYSALFDKWASELRGMEKTRDNAEDLALAKRIGYAPKKANSSLAAMQKLETQAKQAWATEMRRAEEQVEIGAETIKMGIQAIGKAGLKMAREESSGKSDSTRIAGVKKKFAEIHQLLDEAREEGELTEEVADGLTGFLNKIRAAFEKEVASREEKPKPGRRT